MAQSGNLAGTSAGKLSSYRGPDCTVSQINQYFFSFSLSSALYCVDHYSPRSHVKLSISTTPMVSNLIRTSAL